MIVGCGPFLTLKTNIHNPWNDEEVHSKNYNDYTLRMFKLEQERYDEIDDIDWYCDHHRRQRQLRIVGAVLKQWYFSTILDQ